MENHKPLVSIIIPLYNGERYIGDAIESVICQTYTDWELLVVDDGSTDSGLSRIINYLNNPRISYHKKENGGSASARNFGLAMARGEFIALLDQDDTWIPEKLSLQMSCFTEEIDLVFSDARIIGPDGEQTRLHLEPGSGIYSGAEAFRQLIHGRFFLPVLTVVCRASTMKKVGGFNENHHIMKADDFDLWARMLLVGARFFGMQQCTACYRVHTGQSSVNDPANTTQVVASLLSIKKCFPEYRHTINRAIISRLNILKQSGACNPDEVRGLLHKVFPRFGKLHVFFYSLLGHQNYVRGSARLYPLVCPQIP